MNIDHAMRRGAAFVKPRTGIKKIAKIMRAQDIGALPVVKGGRVGGMVTDRDLVVRTLGNGGNPSKLKARDVMTTDIQFCKPDQSLEDAIHLMGDKRIRRLPVIDKEDTLVGMLSMSDVSAHLPRPSAVELTHPIATPHV